MFSRVPARPAANAPPADATPLVDRERAAAVEDVVVREGVQLVTLTARRGGEEPAGDGGGSARVSLMARGFVELALVAAADLWRRRSPEGYGWAPRPGS